MPMDSWSTIRPPPALLPARCAAKATEAYDDLTPGSFSLRACSRRNLAHRLRWWIQNAPDAPGDRGGPEPCCSHVAGRGRDRKSYRCCEQRQQQLPRQVDGELRQLFVRQFFVCI